MPKKYEKQKQRPWLLATTISFETDTSTFDDIPMAGKWFKENDFLVPISELHSNLERTVSDPDMIL